MEEDIEILESFIKYYEAEALSIKYRRNISITVGEDDIEAIENLIKGYRELEEKYVDLRIINDLSEDMIKELEEKQGKLIKYLVKEILEIDEIGFAECNGCKNNDGIYKSENEKCIECRKEYYTKKIGG